MKRKVEEVMEMIKVAEFKPVLGSDRESKVNDENAELHELKALDLKAGIQFENFSGREEECAEWDDLHCSVMDLLDPNWEHILSAMKTEADKIKTPEEFFKSLNISR